MKNTKLKGFIAIALLLGFLSSCNLYDSLFDTSNSDTGNKITGTWSESTYNTKVVISESTYESYYTYNNSYVLSYDANIEKIVYNSLNADSLTTGITGYGYMVVLYNGGAGDGKYGVIRWKNLTDTTVEYSEGYGASYFDSVTEAEAGMDDTYFTWYTKVTKE